MDFNISLQQTCTHVQSTGRYILRCCALSASTSTHTHTHTHIHTYIYIYIYIRLGPSLRLCLDCKHTYTKICSRNTHSYSPNIGNIHTNIHIYIHNKHIRTLLFCTVFSLLVLFYKKKIFVFTFLLLQNFFYLPCLCYLCSKMLEPTLKV